VIPAPVAGTVIRYSVSEGAEVKSGDTVLILESMKMELEIKATSSGKVHFLVATGTAVSAQQPIAQLSGSAVAAPAPAPTPVAPPAPAPAPMPVAPPAPAPTPAAAPTGGTVLAAPMAGVVIRYAVTEGASVKAGDNVVIMESMKMELEIKATAAGKVHFLVATGTQVASQQPIANIG
jgi:oxaloacetate decarboxylase alpha subunit